MTDPSRRSLALWKNMLVKVGKLLLERSEKVGPEKWKERQEKIQRAWKRMDSEKWYCSSDWFSLTLRLYGPFFDERAVCAAYDIANETILREWKANAEVKVASSSLLPPSKPVIGQTVQQKQQQHKQHQISGFPDSRPKTSAAPPSSDTLAARTQTQTQTQTAQLHQIAAAPDSHHTTVVAPSVMTGTSNNVEAEPDAKTCLVRPYKGEGIIWKQEEEKVDGYVNIVQEQLLLHTPVSTTQHSEGAWWSQNIVDHRIAWATLRNATQRMEMRLETGGGGTSAVQHGQSGARWDLGRGAIASKLCELVSRGAQVYMRRMLDSTTAAAWHREQGLARYLLNNLEHSVGGERSCGAAKTLKRRVAIVPRINEGQISTAESLASEMKEHRKKIFARDAKWREELLNDIQMKEMKYSKIKKRGRESISENWWTQLNTFPDKSHMISTVCAGLLEMQRDLAILHEVGPQVRGAKRRMLADAKGKTSHFAYLEPDVTVEQDKDKNLTQTEEQPISSLGSLSDNEDENVQKILQRAHLLLGVRSSAKNKIKITPTDLREFLTELQPFKDRLQISPKVLAKAMLM